VTAACDECRELIGGYVLDALEPGDRDMVRHHIETCELCAREHAELATIPALLDLAESADAVPERPPARLEEAVLDRFARERRGAPTPAATPPRERPRRRRPLLRRRVWGIAGAALASLIVALVIGVTLISGEDAPRGRSYHAQLAAAAFAPGARGEAKLYARPSGTAVHLRVDGLRPPAGKVYNYELWCVRTSDGWKISAGTFRVDADGHADVRLTTAAKPTEYDVLSVQARPAGVAPDVAGQRVLTGPIEF
jgi:anti-sigma-K factor RskA